MMTIAEEKKETLQMMVDAFKFLENQAGNAGQLSKSKNTIDQSRSDEIEIADVISSVRLLNKALLKKEAKEKKPRTNYK